MTMQTFRVFVSHNNKAPTKQQMIKKVEMQKQMYQWKTSKDAT